MRRLISSLAVIALAVSLWREPGIRVVTEEPFGACRVGQIVAYHEGTDWSRISDLSITVMSTSFYYCIEVPR